MRLLLSDDPKNKNLGWSFDYDYIKKITKRAEELEPAEMISMEGVDAVLRALCDY